MQVPVDALASLAEKFCGRACRPGRRGGKGFLHQRERRRLRNPGYEFAARALSEAQQRQRVAARCRSTPPSSRHSSSKAPILQPNSASSRKAWTVRSSRALGENQSRNKAWPLDENRLWRRACPVHAGPESAFLPIKTRPDAGLRRERYGGWRRGGRCHGPRRGAARVPRAGARRDPCAWCAACARGHFRIVRRRRRGRQAVRGATRVPTLEKDSDGATPAGPYAVLAGATITDEARRRRSPAFGRRAMKLERHRR